MVFGVLAVVLAGAAVSAFRSRRRFARAGWVECALRSPSVPTEVGLGERWRHGVATTSGGRLDFRPGGPGGPGGLWLPPGQVRSWTVLACRVEPGRGPGWKSAWSINPGLHVAVLETAAGDLELAADERGLSTLLARIDGSPAGGRPHAG